MSKGDRMMEQEEKDKKAMRLGYHVIDQAIQTGWNPSEGEGAYEYMMRQAYKTGFDDHRRILDATR